MPQMGKEICAVIQAGGKGSRIKELTGDNIPKPMLSLNGKPMLQWQIEEFKAYGITKIVIIIGYLGEKICEYFGDGAQFGVDLHYIKEPEPLGSAGALALLKKCCGDFNPKQYVVIFGDVMFSVDWDRALSFHRSHPGNITLFSHPNAHPYDSDILVADDDNRVIKILSKKLKRDGWYANLVNAGLYFFDAGVVEELCVESESDLKMLDMETDIIEPRLASGTVFAYKTTEYMKDAGTLERFVSVSEDNKAGLWKRKNLRNPQTCVFLDRDGTINEHKGLVYKEKQFELIENAAEAIRRLNAEGILAIVVTNQPVVARGMCGIEDVKRIHKKLSTLLGEKSAYLDDIIFCPHHPDRGYPEENPKYKIACRCRKPKTGMIEEMAEKYNIAMENSYIIGDSTIDIKTGENAGLKTILVNTGDGGTDGKYSIKADFEAEDILEAVDIIISRERQNDKVLTGKGVQTMKDYSKSIVSYIEEEKKVLDALPVEDISEVMNVLEGARLNGRRIFTCGNGGSASTASHMGSDFNKGISLDLDIKYDVECLSDNVPMMMAVSNDIGYDDIFVIPLKNKLKAGDVVLGISGSGNSENVLRAIEYANENGAETIGFTGYSGGKLKEIAKHSVHVNIDNMQITEDIHLVLNHMMMYILSGMEKIY